MEQFSFASISAADRKKTRLRITSLLRFIYYPKIMDLSTDLALVNAVQEILDRPEGEEFKKTIETYYEIYKLTTFEEFTQQKLKQLETEPGGFIAKVLSRLEKYNFESEDFDPLLAVSMFEDEPLALYISQHLNTDEVKNFSRRGTHFTF